ncbi:MAG TPA: CBS domain-containing protein, partial [Saprospiraceae bacterium]|nr:CBS domain-containing protein [Saprospiraceae bacterium]
IGAEQEMCMVYKDSLKPAKINMQIIEEMKEFTWLTTELAKFNLETNFDPKELTGNCFSELERENHLYLETIQKYLTPHNAQIILTGILPTLKKADLDITNLTPKDRYFALMKAIHDQLIGQSFELRLNGIDELHIRHDSPLLEACNTSYQVHLQVSPKDFVKMYNIAQAFTGPVMAIAANSPLVFGKRLWHESRIALFQQALDTRTTHDHMRERSPRVNFGSGWLEGSILEIYKEDISRFRVLLGSDIEEESLELIKSGKVPKLKALQVHNSTVYRWNRPCYGISPNGQPHLRIENRVLPAGPTVLDQIANAAFWLGAMMGAGNEYEDITKMLSYDDVSDNFLKAAKFGIDTNFSWFNDKKISATDLILQELLPLAESGLKNAKVNTADIDLYLGTIKERAQCHMNGARWILRSFSKLKNETTIDEAVTILTSAIIKNQQKQLPVHTWEIPGINDMENYNPTQMQVHEFMETDLFTCQKDDPVELVADMMDWRKINYSPVEDTKGQLVGLMTSRIILRYYAKKTKMKTDDPVLVKDIMIENPITIESSSTILEAIEIMKNHGIGSLPVVQGSELVGIITEVNFLRISTRLIERMANK